jgi:hypothetical protein
MTHIMQLFPHVFYIISMHILHRNSTNPYINIISIKKQKPLHPTKFEMVLMVL